ncbi:MAG: transcriptional regulator [Albidovulum sp.]|uniref:helix-turn-helix transcriptional regulator n=1 Tax=Albidovulum sp. TaxID=1872424 RepID=UPI003CBFD86F
MTSKLIKATTVRNALGGVSDMTLWRWLNDPSLNFPKPIKIQSRRYWRESDVIDWLEAQTGQAA